MVCRCRKAECTGGLASRYFGYQATLHRSVYRALFRCMRQGRSATWRCGAKPLSTPAPCPVPIFGCADTLSSRAAYGTVRLHARSHACGLSWAVVLDRLQHRHWRLSSMAPVISEARVGHRAYLVARCQPHPLNLHPRSGLAQAQPAGIYGVSLQPHVGAVHLPSIPTSPRS
jgi:hypothetical protein